ncbi:acylphosphatase [Methanospirillum purgamenti]|jgi:acylphosphatase|uniref:acylphosphatase n=1 Tax=Methanospirillum hungatei TaxID=2203 RepID=A0A8F5ZEH7_METHU|nr:acylphosphatase [Methanospirillum hungatei]NLW76961.1 acylphosphatase [Methanomicrobiales archaeon]QXO94797.1 acylphosphatase [Methanospirillum hungatei]
MKRVNMIASGSVQGVGFRAYVQKIAQDRHIAGWVRNLADGTVEIEAEGPDDLLNRFIESIRSSKTIFINVHSLQVRDISVTNEQGFTIRR